MMGRNREKGRVPYRTESDSEQKNQRMAWLLANRIKSFLRRAEAEGGKEGAGRGQALGAHVSTVMYGKTAERGGSAPSRRMGKHAMACEQRLPCARRQVGLH